MLNFQLLNMIRDLLFCCLLVLFIASCSDSSSNYEMILPSSDAKTHLYFNLNEGEPYYLVYYNNDILIDWSMCGFVIDDTISFCEGLVVKNSESTTGSQSNDEVFLDLDTLLGTYNEINIQLENPTYVDIKMSVVFRVYNQVVAYKYFLNGLLDQHHVKEITEFDLYQDRFTKVLLNEKIEHDSISSRLIPIENIEYLDLPATFISEEGFELVFLQSEAKGDSQKKLKRRIPGKSEYLLENDEIQTNGSIFETSWRIIYFSSKLNK